MFEYGYEEYIDLTPEQVLQKVNQQQIFEWVLQENFNFAARYRSPFREHSKNHGTCRFEVREDGTILFVDFGDLTGRTHRTCFRMVMDKEGCSLTTALKLICEHFKISKDRKDYKDVPNLIINKSTASTNRASVLFQSKEFNKFDVQEWSRFLIRPEHLIEDNVFSVKKYIIDKGQGPKTFTPYKYCYAFDFIDAVKIYQPYQVEYKWITNCTEDHIGNIDNLPPTGDELIIKKSYKDHRVVRNTIPNSNVIWFQNEGCTPSLEILTMLVNRFKLITIFFDNDATGIVAAMKLVDIFNNIKPSCARMVCIPEDIPYKDPAEFISKEGRADLIEIFKYINLWPV